MLKTFFAGRVGKDAEYRTTQGGTDICSFTVACDVGFGDNKSTVWMDVAKFGKGAQGLSRFIKKGDKITVTGDLTTREHEGKTYLQVRADDIALQGEKRGGGNQSNQQDTGGGWGAQQSTNGTYDDLDDDIPF